MRDLNWTTDGPTGSPGFGDSQTDWITVRTAGQRAPEAAAALEKLCRTYWYPLYAYIRQCGHGPQDAQDLTQEFFAHLLAKSWLQDLHPSKGKFRSFLLASLNHFLANEWRREQTLKRGGVSTLFSLDAVEAEERYRIEPADNQSPDKVFERGWAMTLLKRAETRLQEECSACGKNDLFEGWEGMFEGEKHQHKYARMAGRLGMSEAATRKGAQRLRERYLELLRAEVAQTVNDPAEVDDEMHCLLKVLRE
jgi:DNA-directed RNA polymerase specialized sigma24 family protein